MIGLGEKIEGESLEFVPGILVTPGTTIHTVAESWAALPYGASGGAPQLRSLLQPQSLRSPASLSLNAVGVRDEFASGALVARGDLVIGAGALIQTDPKGSVSLSGETVTVLGSILAPAGSISVSGSKNLGSA